MPKKAKMIEIKIAHLTKGLVTIKVKANSTVKDVLADQGIKAKDIYLNGRPAKKSSKVKAKDVIGVVTQVDGGLR